MSTHRQRSRIRSRPLGDPEAPDYAPLAPPTLPILQTCGALKGITGSSPLRCTLEAAHIGDHFDHVRDIRWTQ